MKETKKDNPDLSALLLLLHTAGASGLPNATSHLPRTQKDIPPIPLA